MIWNRFSKTIAIACSLIFATNAYAGTLNKLGVTGFSPDGAYFAFEQYGVQDGSGFPFSNITIIDVIADKWAGGSPYKVVIEDDTQPALAARQKVQGQAGDAIQSLGISSVNGGTVAHNPISQMGVEPDWMQFRPFLTTQNIGGPIEVTLETYPMAGNSNCDGYGPTQGFRLLLSKGGATQTVHQDNKIPNSRGCPQSYRLDRIDAYLTPDNNIVLAIMVMMYTPGFEGPDATYLVVTKQISR